MAKPHAGLLSGAAAARASSDPALPAPTSIPRADLSSCVAKASANCSSVGSSSPAPGTCDLASVAKASGANRSSVGSSSPASGIRDLSSVAKVMAKRLSYDDDDDGSAFPVAAATQHVPEGLAGLAPLLELPDPDDAASSIFVSAPSHDAIAASARSAVAQVAPPAAGAEGPTVPTEMELVLAELRGARGLSPSSKRLLAALAEAAAAADPLRTRRAAFWRKVRVGVLAAMVFVAAMDVALAVALLGARRGNRSSHALPPT